MTWDWQEVRKNRGLSSKHCTSRNILCTNPRDSLSRNWSGHTSDPSM